MTSYRIRPILTGLIQVDTGAYLTMGRNAGKKEDIPASAWLVEGAPFPILVDTGMCDTERANRWHHPGSRQDEGEDIGSRLAAMGIAPEDVELVVCTHLHWDHCSNMRLFSMARFVVHARELAFALDPIPPYYRSYESAVLGITPPYAGLPFDTVEGDKEVYPGITVFPTPGHSPGHQAVSLDTDKGRYVIAGDAVFCYENLKADPAAHLPFIPPGRFLNMLEAWESLGTIASRAAYVLPGHDIRVFDKEVYP
jgi:N-acyl homoserine lactone hydrolase